MSDEGPGLAVPTMVEKVARAICASDEADGDWPWAYWERTAKSTLPGTAKLGRDALDKYRRRARAAIEAMRPITPEMRDAYDTEACDVQGNAASLVDTAYIAMIDAALSKQA